MDRRWILAIVAIVAVLGTASFFGYRYWWGVKFVPEEFVSARREGALVAGKIVFLVHQSLAGLEQVGGLDELVKYSPAVDLTLKELERNEKARQEAILLSGHLGVMAAFLPQIKPSSARSLATEAIGHEVNLVNHLITFHDLLNRLFLLLRDKFTGRVKDSDRGVKELLARLNEEIKTINNLNLRFESLMEDFDGIYQ